MKEKEKEKKLAHLGHEIHDHINIGELEIVSDDL